MIQRVIHGERLRVRRYFLIVASVAAAMASGCGRTISIAVATSPVVVSTPSTPRVISVVQNFGDSITCGYVSSPADGTGYIYSNEGYAGLFDTFLAVPATNLCRSEDQAADMSRVWVYPNAVPAAGASQLYTVMIGTNDANSCGGASGCMQNWAQALEASLAWLGLPPGDKALASSATTTGKWTADLGFGMATSDAAASITFKVNQAVAGRRLYVAYRVFDAGQVTPGNAALTIDGVATDTLHTQVATGHAISTLRGTTDTIFLETAPLGAAGVHTVTLTTSAAGGFFSVLWAGASTQNYASVSGAPRVMLAQITQTPVDALNPTVIAYNAMLAQIATSFTGEGLYLTTVPTYGALDLYTDMADGLHPNAQGHAKLAKVFESSL
ncbi:GDSL-like Lipase/Acylhydrolase family protein [Bryocella elongata]|uniref:GDSL-like Lipase/Acylhydrolase family protein n=1 Tax=Bryocella elongata TaxID=863522 RepID=A0A1H6AJY3_9BACT|nr:SGNH/GDSL hydrolase family protein [Bryocella elongata]SEG48377.1 GDSL-like Lipase/Acylhydrolase family protein [Bryocella elongata]